jgi:TPR repeat protein
MTATADEPKFLEPKRLLEAGQTREAIDVYERLLAEGGEHVSDAAYSLGIIYHSGIGVPEDSNKAHEYYRKAEHLGNAMATYRLGSLHHREGDTEQALKSFEKVAETNPSAAYWAYRIHAQRSDGQANSAKYLTLAAGQGHILAARIVAVGFARGDHGIDKIPRGIFMYARSIASATKALWRKDKLKYT